jgi:hypothetical protein
MSYILECRAAKPRATSRHFDRSRGGPLYYRFQEPVRTSRLAPHRTPDRLHHCGTKSRVRLAINLRLHKNLMHINLRICR